MLFSDKSNQRKKVKKRTKLELKGRTYELSTLEMKWRTYKLSCVHRNKVGGKLDEHEKYYSPSCYYFTGSVLSTKSPIT